MVRLKSRSNSCAAASRSLDQAFDIVSTYGERILLLLIQAAIAHVRGQRASPAKRMS